MQKDSIFGESFDGDFDHVKVAEFLLMCMDTLEKSDPVLYSDHSNTFIACRTYLVRWRSDHSSPKKGRFDGFIQMVVSVGSYGVTRAILESLGIHH